MFEFAVIDSLGAEPALLYCSLGFKDIQKSIYGYPKIDLWISKIQLDFWIHNSIFGYPLFDFWISNIQPYL